MTNVNKKCEHCEARRSIEVNSDVFWCVYCGSLSMEGRTTCPMHPRSPTQHGRPGDYYYLLESVTVDADGDGEGCGIVEAYGDCAYAGPKFGDVVYFRNVTPAGEYGEFGAVHKDDIVWWEPAPKNEAADD